MNLKQIRDHIDFLDGKILDLFHDRMEQVLMTRKLKSRIEDGDREKELLETVKGRSTPLLSEEFIEKIFLMIIEESKTLQQKDHKLMAFQGEHGAFSEIAAKTWNSAWVPVPCKEFSHVFDGVGSGLYDYGIVPVENTLGGAVGPVNQLLIHTNLHAVGAVELAIHLCLLALPGTDHREIRTVYSHPQALAQSRGFLERNKLDPIPFSDTAGAAKMLSEQKPKGAAAIASKLAGQLYGLEIIKEDVEDLDINRTRFLVLAKDENREEADKCSIIFSTEHKAGTLFSVLQVFAKKGINLTRIESIPSDPGNYAFFLDFIGSDKDTHVLTVLQEVKETTVGLKILGCYKEKKSL